MKNQEKTKPSAKNQFAAMEEKILAFWEKNKIFEKSVAKDAPKGDYVFYDGPPFATGMPHYGHLVASIMKDAVPRYWTMQGFRVRRKWGWDCHGLPVENLAEKELGLKDKTDIEKIGVVKFNEYCESIVMRYANDWKKIIKRIGRWVDMENDYKTMDPEYMESVWWVFKALWEKNLIYKGHKAMHICPRCGTTLSNFEVGLGYKDVKDLSCIAKFKIKHEEPKIKNLDIDGDVYILAWTTTPWTLIGNVALAIGKDIQYALANIEGEAGNYILAADRAAEVLKNKNYNIVKALSANDLLGLSYEPLFDYYVNDEKLANKEQGWKVYAGDFVTTAEGTGIVHIAPAFGEDDLELGKKNNLPFIQHVDQNGRFKSEVKAWPGKEVKPKLLPDKTAQNSDVPADVEIIKYLAHKGLLFHKEKFEHSYPHCWRCETPLLNYAAESWYVKVADLREKLTANNSGVHWVPEHIKDGRFGKWLESARDWAISRNRYWGACLPVWECAACGHTEVIGSLDELAEKSGKRINNLHKQFVDEIAWPCAKCQGALKRVPEVLDCWFESGSMPYAQEHYLGKPLENFDPVSRKNFPAQFIAEGIDQTRGWFYTLLVLSSALFDSTPYENVIANGIVLAADGQKMSKSKQNYPDPALLFDKFGVDAIRFYLLASPVLVAENLNFSEEGVKETLRKTIMLLWNVYKFYGMFSSGPFIQENKKIEPENILDKWILIRLQELISEVGGNIEQYNFPKAMRPILNFIDDLSTWYLRRSRDRFKGADEADKMQAIKTTGYVLCQLSKTIAPVMPFIAEEIWQRVLSYDFQDENKSVHLEEWPRPFEIMEKNEAKKILEEMAASRKIVELALAKRDIAGIKVRQPLAKLSIRAPKTVAIKNAYIALIKDEVNVKEIEFIGNGDEIQVELDIAISPELRIEGLKRELVRQINALRKKQNLTLSDKISLFWETNFKEAAITLNDFREEIKADTLSVSVKEGLPADLSAQDEINIEGNLVIIGIAVKK